MKRIKLGKKDILHLSQLAKLNLTSEEIKRYRRQLEETLDYVDNLNELETERFSLIYNFDYLKNSFFQDSEENKRGLKKKQLTKNLKAKKNLYFVVKRIL